DLDAAVDESDSFDKLGLLVLQLFDAPAKPNYGLRLIVKLLVEAFNSCADGSNTRNQCCIHVAPLLGSDAEAANLTVHSKVEIDLDVATGLSGLADCGFRTFSKGTLIEQFRRLTEKRSEFLVGNHVEFPDLREGDF